MRENKEQEKSLACRFVPLECKHMLTQKIRVKKGRLFKKEKETKVDAD